MRTLAAVLFGAVAFADSTGTIQGVVIDPAGAGVADATVLLTHSTLPGSPQRRLTEVFESVRSGPSGAFHVDAIPSGLYDTDIESPGFRSFSQHQTYIGGGKKVSLGRIVLGIGSPCSGSAPYQPPSIEVHELPSGGTRVSGSAYDPPLSAETHVPPVSIVLTGHQKVLKTLRTTTDSTGRFVFDSVSPGSYSLRASLKGRSSFAVDEVPVMAGQETAIGAFPMDRCPFLGLCRTQRRFRLAAICE